MTSPKRVSAKRPARRKTAAAKKAVPVSRGRGIRKASLKSRPKAKAAWGKGGGKSGGKSWGAGWGKDWGK